MAPPLWPGVIRRGLGEREVESTTDVRFVLVGLFRCACPLGWRPCGEGEAMKRQITIELEGDAAFLASAPAVVHANEELSRLVVGALRGYARAEAEQCLRDEQAARDAVGRDAPTITIVV